jgi:YgiT-type zinc finger domain-containing protein
MKCHICGGSLKSAVTDLPFKVRENSIVIVKNLPVLQCANCQEYLIKDRVMQRLDKILKKTGGDAELEVVRFAA